MIGGVKSMEIFNYIVTVFSNAFIVLCFYIQSYFWYIVIFALLATVGIIEFHEKDYLFVDDERKVI